MKQVSGRKLAKAIEKHGWILIRVQGSHHVYGKEGHRARIVIPIHGNQPLKVGLLRAQMKIAEITESEL